MTIGDYCVPVASVVAAVAVRILNRTGEPTGGTSTVLESATSMPCEGCLEDIRIENSKRTQTERDERARAITELMGDDIDGAQIFIDDLG